MKMRSPLLGGVVLVLAVCSFSGCASPALYLQSDLAYYDQTAPVLSVYIAQDERLEAFDKRSLARLLRARGYALASRAQAEGIKWTPPRLAE